MNLYRLNRCVVIVQTIFFLEVVAGGFLGIMLFIAFGFTAPTFLGLLTIIIGILGFWAITKGFEEVRSMAAEFDSIRRKINDLQSEMKQIKKRVMTREQQNAKSKQQRLQAIMRQ